MDSRRVMDQAVEAYGFDEAVGLVGLVAECVRDATRVLRSPVPIDLELVIAPYDTQSGPVPGERLPVIGLYDSSFPGIGIGLDSESTPDAIRSELRQAVYHEGAHVVTAERARRENPEVGDADWGLFETIVNEGQAVLTEATLSRHSPSAARYRRYIKATRPQLLDGLDELLEVLESGDDMSDEEIDRFRMGDDSFPRKGYKVGYHIVSSRAAHENLTLAEVLELPPADFRTAAEQALDDLC